MIVALRIIQPILNSSGKGRRQKLMNHMRKVATSEDGKMNESLIGLNKTSYSNANGKIQKANSSGSGSASFNANSSYLSEKNGKKAGNLSPTLPYENNPSRFIKKGKRKTFSSAKKKANSVKMVNSASKSISPSIKQKRTKGKSIPFNQMANIKMTRTKDPQDSPCSSFTMDNGNKSTKVEGQNLIEEFNQKYSSSEHNVNIDPDSEKNSETEASIPSEANDGNVAIIHVIDETKKRRQDFKCSTSKLLKHMKYFEKSINGCEDRAYKLLDISVHCDLDTFEWLIKYIHLDRQVIHTEAPNDLSTTCCETNESNLNGNIKIVNGVQVLPMFDAIRMYETSILRPTSDLTLNKSNIITLLVAAEYLKMDNLKEECVSFIGTHFEEICKLKINMNFLKPQTLESLASLVDVEVLDVMRERKDKFISKLFDKKLEYMLKDGSKKLQRCIFCDTLYTDNTQTICNQNPDYFIDAHGSLRCNHIADPDFDTSKFIRFVKEKYRVSWRELYWKIWSFNYTFDCSSCHQEFALPKYCFCGNYSAPKKNNSIFVQSGVSNYPPVREFYHNVKNQNSEIFNTMIKRKHIICESYIVSKNELGHDNFIDDNGIPKTGNSSIPKQDESPKKVDSSKPFHKRINHFEGMNDEEIKFFTPTQQGELLSCNYRLSLHQALQDYLVDLRTKEGRPSDEKSDFDLDEDAEEAERDGMAHPNFFDINIKHERIYKEFDFINRRMEERKKAKIKHAVRVHKRQVREQENKMKETKEKEKTETFQGSMAGDSDSNSVSTKPDVAEVKDDKEETKQSQLDDKPLVDSGSAQKPQDDSGKAEEKQPIMKQNMVVLTPEEMKEKINEIEHKIKNRVKLSRRLIIRNMDADIMDSLSKAVKSKRAKPNNNKNLFPSHSGLRINKNVKSRHRKLKDRMSPHSKVFSSPGPYLNPSAMTCKRPSSVEAKKHT